MAGAVVLEVAWAVDRGMSSAVVAAQLVALDTLDKMAFLKEDFLLELVGTFHKQAADPVEVARSPLEGWEDNYHQKREGTCPVACWHHQKFLPYWKPATIEANT